MIGKNMVKMLNSIAKMRFEKRILLLFFVSLMMVTLSYVFLLRSPAKKWLALREQAQQQQKQIKQEQSKLQIFPAYQLQLKVLQKQQHTLMQRTVQSVQNKDIVRDIMQAATNNAVELQNIKSAVPQQGDNYAILPLTLTAQGNYYNLVRFIKNINRRNYKLTLGDFILTSLEKNLQHKIHNDSLLQLTLHISVFSDRQILSLNSVKKQKSLSLRDPFQKYKKKTALVKTGNILLAEFPLSQLRMVGSIQQDKQWWVLVAAPDEQVVLAKMGDAISQSHKVIKSINEKFIKLEQETEQSGVKEKNWINLALKE